MSTNGYWAVTLLLGFVVAVVAVSLLQIFLGRLHRIEGDAEAIWAAGKGVARNTATTWMLGTTSDKLEALTHEALRHDAFLRGEG